MHRESMCEIEFFFAAFDASEFIGLVRNSQRTYIWICLTSQEYWVVTLHIISRPNEHKKNSKFEIEAHCFGFPLFLLVKCRSIFYNFRFHLEMPAHWKSTAYYYKLLLYKSNQIKNISRKKAESKKWNKTKGNTKRVELCVAHHFSTVLRTVRSLNAGNGQVRSDGFLSRWLLLFGDATYGKTNTILMITITMRNHFSGSHWISISNAQSIKEQLFD